jgi:hypothetical protein
MLWTILFLIPPYGEMPIWDGGHPTEQSCLQAGERVLLDKFSLSGDHTQVYYLPYTYRCVQEPKK